MLNKFLLVGYLLLAFTLTAAYSQDEMKYYNKIWNVVKANNSATVIFEKIDSIKKTRRIDDSKAEILYNRDVDFGITQQKITIVFNGFPYIVNLLVENEMVIFASADFNAEIGGTDSDSKWARKLKIDTLRCQQYLKLHNAYYAASKTINDLIEEISNGDVMYGTYCGSGGGETSEGRQVDSLVRRKNVAALNQYLKSFNLELQAYGLLGFEKLKKAGISIPSLDKKIIKHIVSRNSPLVGCGGCSVSVFQPKKM